MLGLAQEIKTPSQLPHLYSLSLSLLTWYSAFLEQIAPQKHCTIYIHITAFYMLMLKDSQFNLKLLC